MCRLQFYRNMQKKSTNPSIRTLVSFLQCRLLRVFRILPYAHPAKAVRFLYEYVLIYIDFSRAGRRVSAPPRRQKILLKPTKEDLSSLRIIRRPSAMSGLNTPMLIAMKFLIGICVAIAASIFPSPFASEPILLIMFSMSLHILPPHFVCLASLRQQ